MKAAVAVFVLGLTGCTTVQMAAEIRAASDLNCPVAQISTEVNGTAVIAHGCGLRTQYACFYLAHAPPVCIREPPPQVTADTAASGAPASPAGSASAVNPGSDDPAQANECEAIHLPATLPARARAGDCAAAPSSNSQPALETGPKT
jgi:hypothetical protein